MKSRCMFAIAIACTLALPATRAAESECFGSVANGRLEGGVKLPASGANFEAYSSVGWAAGRTYVHSKVAEVILASYGALAARKDGVRFVYGETGWESGGRFRPHRTHQNGLSVDFFVPVKDRGQAGHPPDSRHEQAGVRHRVRCLRSVRGVHDRLRGPRRTLVPA